MLRRIIGLYLSPADESVEIIRGVTEELARRLREESGCEITSEFYDLKTIIDRGELGFGSEAIVVIGVPSIKNRIPMPCLRLLQRIHGDDTRAITVVTSGGSCGNSLYDLYEFAEGQGFRVISAASFIAKAPSLGLMRKVTGCRPDSADFEALAEFCRVSSGKLIRLGGCEVSSMQVKPAPLDICCRRKALVVRKLKRQEPEWFV